MTEPDHVARNRAQWDCWAADYEARGRRQWASADPAWGVWNVPESQVRMLDCDLDPRDSRPVRRGPDLEALLLAHPHVIAFVAGHTHENRVKAFKRGAGGFWGIETASEIDWPIQSRLLEIMDNRDGTLSIFGTLVDHAATLATPRPGTPAAGFDTDTLAALGRELAYNDPQVGVEDGAEGRRQDRNVELLVRDPR